VPFEVVVVDNDIAGSAGATVARARLCHPPYPIGYEIQSERNISITRNRTVQRAAGDWMAFIDDDERATPIWLDELARRAVRSQADGVQGPVVPVLPPNAPAWIRRGAFYNWARMPSGAQVPLNKLRFGNLLLRASLLRSMAAPFDPSYGLTGGEDGDLLGRLVAQGAHVVWCDEAVVREPIEARRLSFRWLMLRALRGGQDFARHSLAGRYGDVTLQRRLGLLARALVQSAIALALTVLVWPFGRHYAAHWLLRASANIGKLSLLVGWHYREYAGTAK
jgi:succinoglycan biosynthesis protein ExoM